MFAVSQSFSLLSSLYDASVDSVVSAGGVPGSAVSGKLSKKEIALLATCT